MACGMLCEDRAAVEGVQRGRRGIFIWYISLRGEPMETAKVFWSGRSQAVRLPRAFRVDAGEVRIRRRGRAIVLEPIPESWEWLDALAGDVDVDFASAVREQPDATERPGLRTVFR